ncbi:MAG TPA: AMP-binding protein, partial [Bdellovibrio sp.]
EYPFTAQESDPVMILYTSGTTGAPKGAILTYKMLFWNSINTTLRLNISQNDCIVIFLPFFHTGGWNVLTTPFIHRGAKVVFLKKFDAEQILSLSEQEKATMIFGVPTTMDMMARSALFEKVDLKSVRYAIVGGEPMPIELIKTWDKKGIPIRQGYGLTEFGPNVFSLNEEDSIRKIGSIGFPNFYIEAKVVDNEGRELADEQVGELVLRGPMCMQGYWHNEKATQETIKEGWLYTGDLVRRDSEGYYYVVGRKKDMYISGGENVYPPEVEQILRAHPKVLEVAVVGVPDEKWGEVGKAFVVAEDASVSVDELLNHCVQNLAKFKIPKHFVFLKSLPKGDSGKILKRKLTEEPVVNAL